eukprot:gene30079-39274_t
MQAVFVAGTSTHYSVSALNFQPRALLIPSDVTSVSGYVDISSTEPRTEMIFGTINLSDNDGVVGCQSELVRVSGSSTNGQYRYLCTFSNTTKSGDYFVSLLLHDQYGRIEAVTWQQLQNWQRYSGYIVASVMEVVAEVDTTPPTVTFLQFSSTTFCYDADQRTLSPPSFTAIMTVKEASGIAGVTISLTDGSQFALACSDLSFKYSLNWQSGSYTNSTYQSTCTLLLETNGKINPVGKYYAHLEANDWFGNSMDLYSADLQAMGFPPYIEYTMC